MDSTNRQIVSATEASNSKEPFSLELIKSSARSFDLFDTLLGRFQFDPNSIFDLVEKRYPFPGFKLFRFAAAMRSDGTLTDIYKKMQELIDLSPEQAANLMKFEFETELDQVFPILENLNLVQDGDWIISDTYYDRSQVQEILKKIGLKKNVNVYASPYGKASGMIWDRLKETPPIFHLGDNTHSDVMMPYSRGILSFGYRNGDLSLAEKKLLEFGQADMAFLIRSLRLLNPYPLQSPEHLIWVEQCQFNLPILISASLYLNDFCKLHGKKRILFTERNCCLWIQVFNALFPEYDSIYYHSSRFVYTNPTPSFIDYVSELYTEETVIVDANGTGMTCGSFFKTHLEKKPCYLSIHNYHRKKNFAIYRKRRVAKEFEKMNFDLAGALYDVQDGHPLRAEPEYDLRWIQPSHHCIRTGVELLSRYHFQPFDPRVIEWFFKRLKKEQVLKFIDTNWCHHHFITDGKHQSFHLSSRIGKFL